MSQLADILIRHEFNAAVHDLIFKAGFKMGNHNRALMSELFKLLGQVRRG